jgi:serine/threonine protein kinase|tara:strand:- start:2317 stop:2616 length:300 start_codon:yes stop_codon:yes gene_type:complete
MGIEYAPGGTLQQLMRRNKREKNLKDEDFAKIVKGILLGLKHLHRNDFVHRDLKPSNVVIPHEKELENLKLIDFGLAVKYQTKQGIDDNCGTLVYQAPE